MGHPSGGSAVQSPFQKKCYSKHRKQASSVCFQREATPEYTSANEQMDANGPMDRKESDISGLIFFTVPIQHFAFILRWLRWQLWRHLRKDFYHAGGTLETGPELPGASLNDVATVTNDSRNKSGCDWFGCITDPKASSNSHSKAADSWYLPFILVIFLQASAVSGTKNVS